MLTFAILPGVRRKLNKVIWKSSFFSILEERIYLILYV